MSYEVYKFIHFISLLFLFLSLGALLAYSGNKTYKKRVMMLHGLSALVLFVSGFGLMARLKLHSFPLWLNLKLLVWLILGVLVPILISQNIISKKGIWFFVLAGAFLAVWLAVFKLSY